MKLPKMCQNSLFDCLTATGTIPDSIEYFSLIKRSVGDFQSP